MLNVTWVLKLTAVIVALPTSRGRGFHSHSCHAVLQQSSQVHSRTFIVSEFALSHLTVSFGGYSQSANCNSN